MDRINTEGSTKAPLFLFMKQFLWRLTVIPVVLLTMVLVIPIWVLTGINLPEKVEDFYNIKLEL